jgi:hypothetical protein
MPLGTSSIRVYERTFSTASWDKNLILDITKSNWQDWSHKTRLIAQRQGFTHWLDGTLKCPDQNTHSDAYWVWINNDEALQGFLFDSISPVDLSLVRNLKTSHAIFTALHEHHENLGSFAQVLLVKKLLEICFNDDTPMSHTIMEIRDLHHRITTMGAIDDDKLLTVALLNSLGNKFSNLQSAIQTLFSTPNFSSTAVIQRTEAEENLIQCRNNGNQIPSQSHTALAATSNRPLRTPCATCKRLNHSSDFCISPGGKLAGKTIEEAHAAQAAHRAAQAAQCATTPKNPTTVGTSTNSVPAPAPQQALAYALIHSHNPKLLPRSVPCIMIGYGSHTKAYRLWDPVTDKIFNSFRVTFIEHLDAKSVPLLPNTILGTDTADVPGSWDTPTIPSPTDHSSTDLNNPHSQLPTPSSHPVSCPISPPPRSSSTQNTINSESQTTQSRIPQTNIQNRHDQHCNYNTVNRSHIHNPNNNQNTNTNIPNNSPSTPSPNNTTLPSSTNQPPPPRHLSRIPIPFAHGLQPSSRLTAIRQEIADSAARQEACNAPPTVSLAYVFISEYSPVCESHDLYPLSLSPDLLSHSLDSVLSSLSDGTIVPAPESFDDPLRSEALVSPEREYWIAGARDELHSLEDLQVFVLVPRSDIPRGQRPLKGKLVCKRKRDDAGNIACYKVRYVAKGYTQHCGVDYEKITAPTARLESFRALLHLGASRDRDIQQYDIKTAFLHSVLPTSETMFMEQPPGFEAPGKKNWVMKLMKSIYGMKQASHIWNQTFDESIQAWGFQRVPCEWCVYHRSSETGTIIFAVHVDDIISIALSAEENNRFKSDLDAKWKISDLSKAKFALGIAMTRDRPNRTISLSQMALIDCIVSNFGQSDAHTVDTPMVVGLHLQHPDKHKPIPPSTAAWIEKTPYQSLIGCLNYLAVGTRPDIAYAIGRLASFLNNFQPEHWETAICVVQYLKGTRHLLLQLGGVNPLSLVGYSNSDYANCPNSKSRSVAIALCLARE